MELDKSRLSEIRNQLTEMHNTLQDVFAVTEKDNVNSLEVYRAVEQFGEDVFTGIADCNHGTIERIIEHHAEELIPELGPAVQDHFAEEICCDCDDHYEAGYLRDTVKELTHDKNVMRGALQDIIDALEVGSITTTNTVRHVVNDYRVRRVMQV